MSAEHRALAASPSEGRQRTHRIESGGQRVSSRPAYVMCAVCEGSGVDWGGGGSLATKMEGQIIPEEVVKGPHTW
eukprot:scaffold8158_cov91-Isochrysis_galbana.AAC.2